MTSPSEESAADLYKRAHDLHYETQNLEEAARLYQRLRARFPDAPEAKYARTQLDNLSRHIELPPPPPPLSLEQRITDRFQCRCGSTECTIADARLATAGAPAYRDSHGAAYLAISCRGCARVELLNREILEDLHRRRR